MATSSTLPGPRGHWLLGALPRLRTDMLGFFEQCFREHGDAAYFRVASRRSMLLSHPDDIEQVLVAENRRFVKNYALIFLRPLLGKGLLLNEGAAWLRQRRLIQPAFSKARVESYAPAMVECAARMLDSWCERGEQATERDLFAAISHLTMEIAGRTLLGVEVTGQHAEMSRELDAVMFDFLARFGSPLRVPDWLPTPQNLRLRGTIARMDKILQGLIEQRRSEGAGGIDFLSLLLSARDEEDGRGIDDRQIRDEVMTMFLAGHETTATALSWTCYLLARHPEVQERVHAEAIAVCGNRGPEVADMPRLAYCERVIKEAMRLFPPAYVIGRRPMADITIGKHFIPANTNVLMSQWIVHRDPRWFPDPLRFHPDRWSEDAVGRLPKYAYFPFGGGPRVCIGNGFAIFEAVLVLAMIGARYQLELLSNEPVRLQPAVTLRPGEPIRVRVRRRSELG